jgi:membrane-associated phospholipid phosphatase
MRQGRVGTRPDRSFGDEITFLIGFALVSLVRVVGGFALAGGGDWRFGVAGDRASTRALSPDLIRTSATLMRQIQSPMWTSVLLTVTKLGSTWGLVIIGSIAGIAFILLRWFRPLVLFIIVMAGQAALHHSFKWLFARPRPPALINYPLAENFSFPSGHAIAALCLYGAIAWLVATRYENAAAKAGHRDRRHDPNPPHRLSRACTSAFITLPTSSPAYSPPAVWTAAVMSADRRPL